MKKNEIILSLTIADFEDITHEEITERLGIIPIKAYIKGQRKNPNFSGLATRNRWIMESSLSKYTCFEDQMNALLDIIEPKIDLFRPFCEKYHCIFSCALFVYYDTEESTPSVHLNSRYNKLIKELNIEFDIDLYCHPGTES